MLESYFKLKENSTSLRRELIAGITTFLAMVYIIFVNPEILSVAGMDRDAVFVATCLVAAFGSLVMGLYANYPSAVAPGMGLNAYFAFTVVGTLGYSWQLALGAVFLSGILFLIISLLPIREALVNAIPRSLKMSISAGIGFLLGIIALENAGFVVAHPATLVTAGDLTQPVTVLAGLGFILIVTLDHRQFPGAIITGILAVTGVGMLLGLSEPGGVFSTPPSLAPTLFQLSLANALELGLLTIVMTFLLVDVFDSSGTFIGVAHQGGFIDSSGRMPRLKKALIADSSATVASALLGTSTATAYVESLAGIRAGGRTGLTAAVVAVLFIFALFFAPLAGSIPAYATAPAILFVACVMARGLVEVDWSDVTDYAPAVVTAITMPLTFSISTGIGLGLITYALVKLLCGRYREANPAVVVLSIIFLVKFAISDG